MGRVYYTYIIKNIYYRNSIARLILLRSSLQILEKEKVPFSFTLSIFPREIFMRVSKLAFRVRTAEEMKSKFRSKQVSRDKQKSDGTIQRKNPHIIVS